MSRRGRALAFAGLAVAAAVGAAAMAEGYGSSVARGYGPLRPVVVLGASLPAGAKLAGDEAARALEVRRVPVRFVPPDALASPAEAVGLVPIAPLPAGSYLQASLLRPPGRKEPRRGALAGRSPVEIGVSGADALLLGDAKGGKVDVVVTAEPSGSGPGRTYVAAREVPLLALKPATDEAGTPGSALATLGLTRGQALRLIAAESFARRVTLIIAG